MDDKSIGRKIRQCREAKGIKREAFAEMVDLSVSYLSALERGEKLPKLDTFIRIANTLEVPSDFLLEDVLSVRNQITASALAQSLAALSPADQKRILNVMETMIADAQK